MELVHLNYVKFVSLEHFTLVNYIFTFSLLKKIKLMKHILHHFLQDVNFPKYIFEYLFFILEIISKNKLA